MRNNWRNWKKEFRIFLLCTQLEVFWYWKCHCVIIKLCERYLTSILDVRKFLSFLMSWSLLLPLLILTVSELHLTAEVFCLFYYYQNAKKKLSCFVWTENLKEYRIKELFVDIKQLIKDIWVSWRCSFWKFLDTVFPLIIDRAQISVTL